MSFLERQFKKYGIVTALVFELVAFVMVGFFTGRYADEKMQTQPWMLTAGVLLGFVTGIWRFYTQTKRFLK